MDIVNFNDEDTILMEGGEPNLFYVIVDGKKHEMLFSALNLGFRECNYTQKFDG